jgi:hypothetical protein
MTIDQIAGCLDDRLGIDAKVFTELAYVSRLAEAADAQAGDRDRANRAEERQGRKLVRRKQLVENSEAAIVKTPNSPTSPNVPRPSLQRRWGEKVRVMHNRGGEPEYPLL